MTSRSIAATCTSREAALRLSCAGLVYLALALAAPAPAAAECITLRPEQPADVCTLVNGDEDIFIGRVVAAERDTPLDWRMRVIRSFRGSARGEIVVGVWSGGDMPGFAQLEVGRDYLFYASRTVEGGVVRRSTSIGCGRSWAPLENVAVEELDLLARLGSGGTDGRISGTLTRNEGLDRHPLAGIRITVTSRAAEDWTITDDAGRFDIRGLPPGAYRLATTVPPALIVTSENIVELRPHACAEVDLSAEPNTVITGTVTLPPGFDVDNTRVTVFDTSGREVESAPADRSGRYAIYGLSPGDYVVGLGSPPSGDAPLPQTYAPATTNLGEATRIRVEGPQHFRDVDIMVASASAIATVTVTAMYADGSPARETALNLTTPGLDSRGSTRTNGEGVADIRMVVGVRTLLIGSSPDGCIAPLELGPDSFPSSLVVAYTADGCREYSNLETRVRLKAETVPVRVRVVSPNGAPVYKAELVLDDPDKPGRLRARFLTDRDGYVDLPAPLDDEFRIQARHVGTGLSCSSEFAWFKTKRRVMWQSHATAAARPDWNKGAALTGELVVRLEGLAC